MYRIQNKYLAVCISSKGAELQSIKGAEDREYLWQGDSAIWNQRAPVLFPYIGRMTEQSYRYGGNIYHMGIHGFAAEMDFAAEEVSGEEIAFSIEDSEKTRRQYPFSFLFTVRYWLKKNRLHIRYEVTNRGSKAMYFGLGGHPGFQVPQDLGQVFEDYEIVFEKDANPVKIGISETGFVTEKKKKLELSQKHVLPLTHELFDLESIVLAEAGKRVVLCSKKGSSRIILEFADMPYLGLWQMEGMRAPYVCIEPWSSLPSRQDLVEELEKQENLICLEPGRTYYNPWSIEVEE